MDLNSKNISTESIPLFFPPDLFISPKQNNNFLNKNKFLPYSIIKSQPQPQQSKSQPQQSKSQPQQSNKNFKFKM